MVKAVIGQYAGYGQWMGNVRLTAAALLAIVCLFGVKIGAANLLDLGGR
jgi:hypothetical protein